MLGRIKEPNTVAGLLAVFTLVLMSMLLTPAVEAARAPPADPAIAYFTGGTTSKLAVMNADGSNTASIYSQFGCEPHYASWSPDGKAIAFRKTCNVPPYTRTLWRIDVSVVNGVPTGSNARQLTAACGACYDSAWSPTGDVIAVAGGNNPPSIFLVDANTGTTTTLYTAVPGSNVLYVAWSSDGTRLAVAEDDSSGLDMIRIVERATGKVVKTLIPGLLFYNIVFIDWARQGVEKLAIGVDATPTSTRSIYTVDIATETYTRIVDGNAPAWSPDNSKLAFNTSRSQGGLVTIELATGIITKVGGGSFPDWRRF